ncbi:MAG TPA: alkaline phosphatase family protein [Gaiellaceae bacterium]|nr:alkaline phosphatase family protein [Gaiellaceae bacterium]
MTEPRGKVVMVVLDACEPALLDEGMSAGWLPNLARFFAAGASLRLAPVDEYLPGTAWPSLNTGVPFTGHRMQLDRRLAPRSYRVVDVRAGESEAPPFWRYVSDHGLRSTVANLYSAPLVEGLNGTQLQGWATIDPYTSKFGLALVDPPQIQDRLERAAGRPATLYEVRAPESVGDVRRYRDGRIADIRTRTSAHALLMRETDWALYVVSYPEAHQAGHLLWHVHDPEHPDHDPEAPEDVRDAVRALYRELDTAVGKLLELCPKDATVLLLSPHGMGANRLVGDPAPEVLRRANWLVSDRESGRPALKARLRSRAWQEARRVVPERIRLAMRRRLADREWVGELALQGIAWEETRAFAVPPDAGSYVRLNVRGREPAGIVEPGIDYARATDELARLFGDLRLGPDGEPAVDRVLRAAELGGRPDGSDGTPDVLVVWSKTARVERVHSDLIGTVEVPRTDGRTGQHRPLGFVAGVGPGIAAAGSAIVGTDQATLLDVAPTALALLGVPQPSALPGSPIAALV